ncbi:PH domain-containing protein [Alteromonas sp. C1M14]|uniref:PH domain-containing protein n=1 Tax=Alteromonas sp. C1M14 TaxID=2841567 RepID=UPI001C07F200|nr:PH domain-containing protein [Alteromonas sp. C1M14]MBU2979487.1 PH domain-containing protein [Alteromonas sp. C1M14]
MADSDKPEGAGGKTPWQRLPPVAIVYFIVANVFQFVRQFIVGVSVLAYSASTYDIQGSEYFIPALITIFVATVCSGVISYWFYHYRIRDQHVEIRDGVLKRRNMNLPFWRIQNVKIERPFYYRFTQYAVLVLDTAGSAEEEAKIVALSCDDANALRQQILSAEQHKNNDESTTPMCTEDSPDAGSHLNETVINRRQLWDLILHGLTNNRVWLILGALAPFYDDIGGAFYGWIDAIGLSPEKLFPSDQVAWWQISLYVVSLMLVVFAVMASVSVAGSVITYYNYTLSRTADRYIRRSGLFSLQEVSMRQSRVQQVAIKQDWLDFLLKRANLFFEQNKTGNQQEQELHATNKLLVPSVTYDEAFILAQDALPDNRLDDISYLAISRRFLYRYFALFVLPVSCGVWAITHLEANLGVWSYLWSLVTAVGLMSVVYLRWRRWGVAFDSQYCYVRKGLVGLDKYCFALHKVQQVVISQSIFMRRRGLANIRFVLASGDVTVPFLSHKEALHMANRVLWEVESQRRSWM